MSEGNSAPATAPFERQDAGATSYVGRGEELERLADELGSARVLTLTGAPGIGKSRLAVELMRGLGGNYADGARLVELAPVREASLVREAVAAALSVTEAPGRSVTETLTARMRQKRLVLVLDHCEHQLDACRALVGELLESCLGLVVLATSREPLRVAGEHVWQVRPLSVPASSEAAVPQVLARHEAVRLFVERAAAVQPEFRLNAYVAPAVAEIARRTDGIPLAIELAAARVDALTPAEIAARLDDRFTHLMDGSRAGVLHRRPLQAALGWSHDLLSGAERALLRRLSVFVGGFGAKSAEDVCSGGELQPAEVSGLLETLAAKSLVMAASANGSATRFRLLETIKAFAAEQLEGAGEQAAVREAHARHYLALAEEAEPELTGPEQRRWFERLEVERANLRAALEWSLGQGHSEWTLRLAGALVLFWRVRCHFTEGRQLLDAALLASQEDSSAVRVKVLWGSGFLALMADDREAAINACEESLARFEELGDLPGRARSLLMLGNARTFRGDDRALALLEQSATLAREADDSWCLSHALGIAGSEHYVRGESAAARPLFEECIGVARAAEDLQGLRWGLLGLGELCGGQGDYGTAEHLLHEALEVMDELGEEYMKAEALRDLGQLALARGDLPRAGRLLDETLTLIREVGHPGGVILTLILRSNVARAEGDLVRARQLLDEALALARASGDPAMRFVPLAMGDLAMQEGDLRGAGLLFEEALDLARASSDTRSAAKALYGLGQLAGGAPDMRRANALHAEALELFVGIGDARGTLASIEALAELAAACGHPERAARLLGAAAAQRERGGRTEQPSSPPDYVARVRDELTPGKFDAIVDEGAALTTEQAVAEACEGRNGHRGRPATGWSSLTPREREVAALAGAGLTNPEIAERLVISLGTVKDHLSSIFVKLGVTRRNELIRQVSRHTQQPLGLRL